MARQIWVEPFAYNEADGAAVHTTTTETALFPAPVIPANYMCDGRILVLEAYGKLSTTGTPTIGFVLRYGAAVSGVLLAQSELLTNGSGVSNVNWHLHGMISVRTNGSAGTLLAMGEVTLHTSATATLTNVFGVSGYDAPAVSAACDLTASTALTLGAVWSASSASNTITGMHYLIKSVN
jgi:hypothetical protein